MNSTRRHIIIGTSGHIDHGKSAIVKALTGMDPDRLLEEKQRGLTIDLGYAFYDEDVAFIDVPGHEKFIKNMVAGVTTIDFVLLVVAADDGVMPQTREHLDILQILGLERGIIAINKIDLVESEWLELVKDDVRSLVQSTFLQNAPVVPVSAETNAGIDNLRQEIDRMIRETSSRRDRGYFWLPIDRSFSIQGFGTVVTGSVVSGELHVGEEVELLPKKQILKVRGLQRHNKSSDVVHTGDRAAVNLPGIHRDEITRGDILATPGYGLVTKRFDVQLNLLKSSPWIIKNQHRLRLHIGTNEIFARVRLLDRNQLQPGDFAFAQLILEKAISANRGDRFVVRNYSPMKTIGGGIVLDNSPLQRHRRNDPKVLQHFQTLLDEKPETIILEYLQNSRNAHTSAEISRATSLQKQKIIQPLEKLVQEHVIVRLDQGSKTVYFAASAWNMLEERIMKTLEQYHERHPYLPGMSRAELTNQVQRRTDPAILDALIDDLMYKNKITRRNDLLAKYGFSSELTENQQHFYQELQDYIQQFGFTAPTLKEVSQNFSDQKKLLDTVLSYGRSRGEIVVLANGLVYRQKTIIQMQGMIRDFIARHQKITVADFRDLIQASRKFAVALLEYFDEIGFTRREDDERILHE